MGGRSSKPNLEPLYNRISELSGVIAEMTRQNEATARALAEERTRYENMKNALEESQRKLEEMAASNDNIEMLMRNMDEELQKSREQLTQLTQEYTELVAFMAEHPVTIRSTSHVFLLGPKGKGKTTLMNLCGYPVEPSASMRDGTIVLEHFPEYGHFLDSVGVDASYRQLCRVMAIFLRDGFPASVAVFYKRPLSLLPVFHMFAMTDFFYCPIEATVFNFMYAGSGFAGTRAEFLATLPASIAKSIYPVSDEEALSLAQFPSVKLLSHTTPSAELETVSSFEPIKTLLSDTALPPLLTTKASVNDIVRIDIFREYKRLLSHEGTLNEFLNPI